MSKLWFMRNLGNPLLAHNRVAREATGDVLTIDGVINKTGFTLLALLASFGFVWYQGLQGEDIATYTTVGFFTGLVLAMIIIFARVRNPIVILSYALCEGLLLGGVSYMYEQGAPGIVSQAAFMTMGCFGAILVAYKFNIVRYSPGFARFLTVAIAGVCVAYFAGIICSFFGMPFTFMYDSSPVSIGISLFVVGLATLSFVIDFEGIKWAAENGVDKQQEWYCAFSLVVTLVWLYIEMLRLLSKLRDR